MSDLLGYLFFRRLNVHKYNFIHTSWTRRYSFVLSLFLSSFHSENSEKRNLRWSVGVHECAKKKAAYKCCFSWIAKDKNVHNYTPKCFASSCSADSPRSNFKHCWVSHEAVKKNIARYVGGERSDVICFPLRSSKQRWVRRLGRCSLKVIRVDTELRNEPRLLSVLYFYNNKYFFAPSGVGLWGHIK